MTDSDDGQEAPAMNVIGYLRVSTKWQTEEEGGLGPEVQRRAINAWAKANGHRVAHWCSDAGVSGGTELEERPGLSCAMTEARARKAGIVVYRLDRLARDLIVQEALLREFRRAGVAVFSTMAGEAAVVEDDPSDPSRKLIRQVLGAVAEYERELIKLRLAGGRAAKRARGGRSEGAPPYGWRAHEGGLVPIPEEQSTLARVRELTSGGASLRVIAGTLEAEGRFPRRGAHWHPSVIANLIRQPELPVGAR